MQYLNALPLIHGWPETVDFDHPAALARKLASGVLDAAFVSAAEFLRDPNYHIVGSIAVASRGPVYSVIVAHELPLAEITEISPEPASLTSNALLRVLCAERGIEVSAREDALPLASFGKLLIGDQALRFRAKHSERFSYWDLATAWRELTGLPFVFALWLVRAETPSADELANRLRALRDQNLAKIDSIVASVSKDYSPSFCHKYFSDYLSFTLDERALEGLQEFYRRGLSIGLDFAKNLSFTFI